MPRTLQLPVTAPTKGLNYAQQPFNQDPSFASGAQNVRLKNQIVMPSPGYSDHGTLNTVLGTPQLFTQYIENDGDVHPLCFTTKYIYEYNSTLGNWGNVVSRQKVLSECDVAWTASANVTASQETTIKVNGTASAKFVIAGAFTTGLAAYEDFAAVNTTTTSYIHFWIRSSIATTSGQLRLCVDDTSACASPLQYYDVPALTPDTWTQVEVAIGSGSNAAVISVGLDVQTDVGADGATVYIDRVIMADRFTGTEANRWSVDHYLDKFYATNTVDPIMVKDHSTAFDDWAEAVSAGYKCRVLAAFRNHLCMGSMIEGGTDYPQRFRWTDSGAVTFGGTAGSTETEGKDEIIRLLPLNNRLAVYKEDSIVLVTHIGGSTVYRFDVGVRDNGLIAQDLALSLGDIHIFASSDNLFYYAGGSDPVAAGDLIRDEFYRIIEHQYVGRGFSYYSPENEEAYFFIPTDGASAANVCWVLNVKERSWAKWFKTGMTAIGPYNTTASVTFGDAVGTFGAQTTTFGDRAFSSTSPILLIGTTGLTIYKLDESTPNDDGSAVDRYYDTPDFTANGLTTPDNGPVIFTDAIKRWVRLAFEARGTGVDVYYSKDGGSTWILGKSVALNSAWTNHFVSFDVPSGRIRFRWRSNSVSATWYLRWFAPSVIGRSEV